MSEDAVVQARIRQFGANMRRKLGLLNSDELAATLECTAETVRSWRKNRIGPRYAPLGRRVFYREAAIMDWAAEMEGSGAEEDEAVEAVEAG